MKHLRLWILGAALGSFVAGMNVGYTIPKALAAGDLAAELPAHLREDLAYVDQIVANYGLSSAQERSLRLLMQAKREDEDRALRSAPAAQLPRSVQERLLQARSTSEQRLRALLSPAQRERYDIDSRPQQNR